MSKIGEFTIGTKLTKTEAIKILKHNTEPFESFDPYNYWRVYTPLPFYGKVYGSETFKVKLPIRRRGIRFRLKLRFLIALKGSVESDYNYTKVKVKACEFNRYVILSLIFNALIWAIIIFSEAESNSFPGLSFFAVGIICITNFSYTFGRALLYIHRAKNMLKEILYAD